jgi:hypothetical protein
MMLPSLFSIRFLFKKAAQDQNVALDLKPGPQIIYLCWQGGSINVDYPHSHQYAQRKKKQKRKVVIIYQCRLVKGISRKEKKRQSHKVDFALSLRLILFLCVFACPKEFIQAGLE